MFSFNHRRRSSSVTRRGRQVPSTEQLEVRALMTSWVGQIGGAGNDSVASRSITDSAGNMFVGGVFSGVADFDPGSGATNLTSAGSTDAYIAKYSSDGSLLWARRFGGGLEDMTNGLRLDPTTGSLYATGSFRGSADFTGDSKADLTSAGDTDVFILKLNPINGSTVWQKSVGGESSDIGYDIAAADGYVYVTGDFRNSADFNPGAVVNTLTAAGNGKFRTEDGFLLKLTDTGNYVSAWRVGAARYDSIRNLVVDGATIYVLGSFTGTVDIDMTAGVYPVTSTGDQNNPFLASYSTTGTFNWGRTISGSEIPASLQLGSDAGFLYVTGEFGQTVDCNPGGAGGALTSAGSRDAFVAKYAKTGGSFTWARSFGGASYDTSRAPAVVSADGSVYVGGWFYQTVDFNPGVSNGGELSSAGLGDGFVLKLDASGSYRNAWRMGGPDADGGAQPVAIYGGTVYVAGRFAGTANFPTGATLTSYGGHDAFLMALNEATSPLSPLLAAALPANSVEQSLTASEYQPVVSEARRRWEAAGVNTATLSGLNVQVGNLGGTTLGLASGNTIWLDDNAAGWGWFVDSTPGSSSEFVRPGNQGEKHRMDLLTVVMHEIGHLLGQEHNDDGVMEEALATGVRRTEIPSAHTALVDQVFSQLEAQQTGSLLDGLLDDRLNSRQPWFQRRR